MAGIVLLDDTAADSGETLVYSLARPDEVDEVFELALQHFFAAQPLRQIHFFDEKDETKRPIWRLETLRRCFAPPTLSIVVREKTTGDLVAFMVNEVEERSATSNIVIPNNHDDRSTGWLARALGAELNRGVDLFDRYGTDKIVHNQFSAVRPDYANRKVFIKMSSLTRWLGFKKGAGAIKGEVFTNYIPKDTPYEVIKSVDFSSFQLPNGVRPLADADLGVHRTARLLAHRLPLDESVERRASGIPIEEMKRITSRL